MTEHLRQGAPLGPGEERFNLGTVRVDDSTLRTGADAMVAGSWFLGSSASSKMAPFP